MGMKTLIGLFVVIALFLANITAVHALPKHIHIGKQQDYPPYIFEVNGKTVGICAELAEAAFHRLGITVTYSQYPFPRMLKYGQTGDVDAVMLVFKTQEREKYLYFPDHALSYEENSFFTLKDFHISYSGNVNELKNHTVGVIRGFSYGHIFDNATFIKRIETADDEMLIKLLLASRYKIAVGCKSVINYHAEKNGIIDKITFLTPNLFSKKPLYIGFSKAIPENRELTIKFSEALSDILKTDTYHNILNKYNIDHSETNMK